MEDDPPFYYMLRASGQGEVWRDIGENDKFHQYGWRCTTSEDAYSTCTLIGNWFEERFDIRRLSQRRPLPSQGAPLQSQYGHYFETEYSSHYSTKERHPCTSGLKSEAHSLPGHQPELNPPQVRCVPISIYRQDFRHHPSHLNRSRAASVEQLVQTGAGLSACH